MDGDDIRATLARIEKMLGWLESECDEYGGWAGYDQDAVFAVDLGLRLAGLGHYVGLFGREVAESGEVPTLGAAVAPSPRKVGRP